MIFQNGSGGQFQIMQRYPWIVPFLRPALPQGSPHGDKSDNNPIILSGQDDVGFAYFIQPGASSVAFCGQGWPRGPQRRRGIFDPA
jgi:hypothetical protein